MNPHARCLFALPFVEILARSSPSAASRPRRHSLLLRLVTLCVLLDPARGAAQQPDSAPSAPPILRGILPQRFGFFAGVGYLGSPSLHGVAFELGLRYRPIRWFALSFDLGYGVLGRIPEVQDRWWLMPAAALVIPAGPVHLDLGVGLGFGASSGYTSWGTYVAAPFTPIWALQLVPAARGHARAAIELTNRVDLFVRCDVASLLLEGNSIGSRVGNADPGILDTTWYDLLLGVQVRIR